MGDTFDSHGESALGAYIESSLGARNPVSVGDLVVGGVFTSMTGITARRIGIYDGDSFTEPDSGASGGSIYAATNWNGDLIVGGSFTQVGSPSEGGPRLAKLVGASDWEDVDSDQPNGVVYATYGAIA